MRRNLAVIALGLLAVTGCARERPNRNEVDETPYTGACIKSCGEPQPNGRLAWDRNPYAGTATLGTPPPVVVAKPVVTPQSGLPPVQAVPQLPYVVVPRESPVAPVPVPTPMIPDSGASPAPSKIPEIEAKLAPATRARTQDSAQTSQVLTGTVEAWRKTQRLRYAPADVEEANGGLVTLVGDPEVDRVKEGQRIRVRGFLIPSADRAHPPTFQVQSLEVVE